ncbi:hypothetical protein CC80DRAFT_539032 [Byssothecium circinans]|uniref:F-box domain-containing protein n=1 Tax=Byssothecium circinans TaxID=147558 RepID=A0A6A5TGW9_9PLEO|nr:hypothetical protein CC80DRAFT_539032 [Byssothecium circinans]
MSSLSTLRDPAPDILYTLRNNPPSSPTLATLPNEILLEIFEQLDTADLLALSLVTRTIQEVAEVCLYRKVKLSEVTYRYFGESIELFLRSIVTRPPLADRIKSIDIQACNKRSWIRPAYLAPSFPGQITIFSTSDWGRIHGIVRAGLLIDRLPCLRELRLDLYGSYFSRHERLPPEVSALDMLFGDFINPQKHGLHLIRGLAGLQRLTLEGMLVELQWFRLPSLEYVTIGQSAILGPDTFAGETFQLQNLTFGIRNFYINSSRGTLSPLVPFLAHFTSLRELSFHFKPVASCMELLRIINENREDFDLFLSRLQTVKDTLEVLRLSQEDKRVCFSASSISPWAMYTTPIRALIQFARLRVLEIPQAALLGTNYTGQYISPIHLLPASLETVLIWNLNPKIIHWLRQISTDVAWFPKLSEITLLSSLNPKDAQTLEESILKDGSCKGLSRAGVRVTVEGRQEWGPEEI